MPRPYLYHVYHRSALDSAPAWADTSITVPGHPHSGTGPETKKVYSLKKDMEQLRSEGAAKGIVDASLVSIGKSYENRELWALKVGNGTAHKVLFTGCHHAREWISVEIPYLVAEYLIQNYTDSPGTAQEKRIKHLLMNRQIWFIPMVNPDGHEYTTKTDRDWRTNRGKHHVPAGTISRSPANGGNVSYPAGTYVGVDLNRNYATANWGNETFHHGYVRTSRDPRDCGKLGSGIWCGVAGSGEPESALIDALIRANRFRASITYHSYSQLLLYPDAAQHDDYLQWVGKGMDELIKDKGNPYKYQSGSALYPTTGDLMDFSYEQVAGRPTYTPELRPKHPPGDPKWTFSGLPENQIEDCFKENLPAALALINCAGHDAKAAKNSARFTSGKPHPGKTQFVRHAWKVFKGWSV